MGGPGSAGRILPAKPIRIRRIPRATMAISIEAKLEISMFIGFEFSQVMKNNRLAPVRPEEGRERVKRQYQNKYHLEHRISK